MTKEELENQIIKLKENCKKLAEEYRERYNQDNEDKIALNMFYHNVISYNDYESVLALFENRNSMIMCFSAPPVLTEETVEINLKRIEELEKENAVLEKRIERAKECMKKLLFIINSDPANYNCKGLVQDAEDFIYNRTCNIRQLGEHCISETRCIMCDMEDKRKNG